MKLRRALERSPAFADFPGDVLDLLGRSMVLRRYRDGQDLVVEGDTPRSLFLVVEGEAEVTVCDKATGRRRAVARLGAGDLFGEYALIIGSRRSATVSALGDVEVAELPAPAFTMLYQSEAPISVHFQLLIARQLTRDARRLNDMLLSEYRELMGALG